ncbi:YCF48-related protein [Undibacterium sp. Di27W]|uniref:YCF48-related protein n=1 Tax=Undibacterium sp. Di27W TaxID=3413036 RepID=UPI003BF1B803
MQASRQQEASISHDALPPLLAWHWLWIALALFVLGTIAAWTQKPRPVPVNRAASTLSFLWPNETNPHRRLPRFNEDFLAVIFSENGKQGWILSKNHILTTDDGGNSWHTESNNNEQLLAEITRNENSDWMLKNKEIVFSKRAIKELANFKKKTVPGLAPALHIDTDGKHAWTVGANGIIMATSNGGETWSQQSSNLEIEFSSVYFQPDKLHGWVVGKNGVILATDDAGNSWHPYSANAHPFLASVSFSSDGLHGWAVGGNGDILASSDGGAHWKHQHSGIEGSLGVVTVGGNEDIYFLPGAGGEVESNKEGDHSDLSNEAARAISLGENNLHIWAAGTGGAIISTDDGGITWNKRSDRYFETNEVRHAYFTKDRTFGWSLTANTEQPRFSGELAVFTERKPTWETITNDQSILFSKVYFDSDTKHGWGITTYGYQPSHTIDKDWASVLGQIVNTTDGGKSWQQQTRGTPARLFDIHFNKDKQHGWAVGEGGLILSTMDGGKNWDYAEHYSRSPALWYWLLVAISGYCIWLSWHFRPKAQTSDSVADVAASDAEIRFPDDDKLDFSGLARGISRFLRNTETQPPLTLAITGEWGSGKSSLMQLVCADLKKYAHSPIWFNAWHHQKQECLFAGLLGAIHAQAAPSTFTVNGMQFRLHLLWLRSRRHFGAMMLAIILASCLFIISYDSFQRGGIQRLLTVLPDIKNILAEHNITILVDSIGGVIAALGAAFTTLYGLAKGSKIFASDPATLMTRIGESMSLKTAKEKNDFRDDFASQFSDLTKALPYRLVIVIDDLDRCHPAAILEVMETVNYLTSSGDCFVIFGMAKERVLAALGLAFKDIAAEMVAMDKHASQDEHDNSPLDPVLIKRRAYAIDYLQKLVNIEIKVPTTKDKPVHQLLFTKDIFPRRRIKEFFRLATFMWPIAAAIIAICIGVSLAKFMMNESLNFKNQHIETKATPAAPKTKDTTLAPADFTAKPPAPASTTENFAVQAPASGASKQALYADEEHASWMTIYSWSSLALLPLLGIASILLIRLLRKNIQETRDSNQFRQALEIWTGVIVTKRHTPRSIKRFGNRLRYLAMLQQGEAKDETLFDQAKLVLTTFLLRKKPNISQQALLKDALAEHQLIAIGAMHEVFGENWKNQLSGQIAFEEGYSEIQSDEARLRNEIIETAISKHQASFGDVWPPSDIEVEVFERLISGVRLAGDPQILTPQRREEKPEANYSSLSSIAKKRRK